MTAHGSATDVTARIFAQKFTEAWGVTVAVDNVPCVGGAVGVARVAKSPPDGYTLILSDEPARTRAGVPAMRGDWRDYLGRSPARTIKSVKVW